MERQKQHYISKFILKNFTFDGFSTNYTDAKTLKTEKVQVKYKFQIKNLYKDEKNQDYPNVIEDEFSKFENDVSRIIKNSFLKTEEFDLTKEESDKLILFFVLMAFRSKRTKELFNGGLSQFGKKMYSKYQPDYNFDALWKRNLRQVVKCRSYEEVIKQEGLDDIFKLFLRRDCLDSFARKKVLAFVRPKEGEFVLSDCYPVSITGTTIDDKKIDMLDYFPVSPDRAIILYCQGVEATPRDVLPIRPLVFMLPKEKEENLLYFRVKSLYEEEVKFFNDLVKKHAEIGYICKSK